MSLAQTLLPYPAQAPTLTTHFTVASGGRIRTVEGPPNRQASDGAHCSSRVVHQRLSLEIPTASLKPPAISVYHMPVSEALPVTEQLEIAGEGWLAAFSTAAQAPGTLDPAALARPVQAWASSRLGRAVPVLYADQRHTALIFSYSAHGPLAAEAHCVGICDGLLTAEPYVTLTVRTADCLPVVMACPGVAAILHCGWRSLAGDIIGKCVRRFAAEYGVVAETLQAVIGVGIGPCHYGVGPEVVASLAALPAAAPSWIKDGRVDLAAWTKGRLMEVGLPANHIRILPGCTACSPHHHSFRRDGQRAGRQWTAVVLTAS